MTLSTSAPEQGLIASLPATLAGLWTAITVTHDIAVQLVSTARSVAPPPASMQSPTPARRQRTAWPSRGRRRSTRPSTCRRRGPSTTAEVLPLVSALTSSCIDLAVDLLGNEVEPLSSAEVLAVTRAVTALCAARSLAQGAAA